MADRGADLTDLAMSWLRGCTVNNAARLLAWAMLHFSVHGRAHAVSTGGKIVIPASTPHYFWNEGDEEARAIQEFRPALRTEAFFETYFALARDGKLNAQGLPSPLRTAVLTRAFGARSGSRARPRRCNAPSRRSLPR